MYSRLVRWASCIAIVAIVAFVVAAPPAAAQDQPEPKCASPEYRQFDFWVGEWDVTNLANGQTRAVNKITTAHNGCVIREDYVNGPYSGSSLNFYDKKSGKWYQTWIDNQGSPLFLSGGLEDGKMVLSSGSDVHPIQRITWTPNEDGTVRQHWQASKDGGEKWDTVFDGMYKKRGATASE